MATTSPVDATGRPVRSAAMLPTLVVVTALVALVSSLGAPLIPSIARADGVSLGTAEWVLTAALMTGALATPTMGRLADGPHQRRVIEVALATVVAGCALSALSTTFALMVIGRGLQGVGLGLLPVTMAIARRWLPGDQVTKAVATLSVTAAVGAGLGYPVTALVAQAFDFRAAYWFGAATVGLALLGAVLVLPGSSGGVRRRLDLLGVATLGGATLGVSVMLSEGGSWGWTSARSIGLAVASAGLVAAWVLHETRTEDPLIDVRQLANRSVLTADLSGFLIAVAMYLFLPVVIVFVQIPTSAGYGFGASIIVSGFVFVPLSIGSFLSSRWMPAYDRRFGPRTMIPFGSLLFAAAALFFLLDDHDLWAAFVASGISGIGIGFTLAAMPTFIVRAVPESETGSAMGLYQVLRSIGLAVGSALAAAVLAAYTPAGQTYPELGGFTTTLTVATILCVLTAIVSYLLPGSTAGPVRRPTPALEGIMREEAEVGAAGLMLADEPLPHEQLPHTAVPHEKESSEA